MAYIGGAVLAWQSDYSQFYLIDGDDAAFVAPDQLTPEIAARGWSIAPGGLAVYTQDCLKQLIEIRLFDAPSAADATEWRSQRAWTKTETAPVVFPAGRFTVSSPSRAGTEASGPWFMTGATSLVARLQWMELPGEHYDEDRRVYDVIRIDLWPDTA